MKLPFHLVDVFTDRPLEGNQLAVFPEAGALDGAAMQAIAREMHFSESTFVTGREQGVWRTRIFTPDEELPFAGHPSLGTAAVLCRGEPTVTLALGVGLVPVGVKPAARGVTCELTAVPARELPCAIAGEEVARAFALTAGDLDPSLPPAIWSCGNAFLFVALRRAEDVARARALIPELPEAWALGVVLYALDGLAVKLRALFPGTSIVEDPATGSANAPLAAMLHARGRLREGETLVTTQGVEIRRPSTLYARMARVEGVLRPRVAGGVVPVAKGELEI